MPNVKRVTEANLSVPTMARRSPKAAAIRPFSGLFPDTVPTMLRPVRIIQKYSVGPNLSAKEASGMTQATSSRTLIVPPTNPE